MKWTDNARLVQAYITLVAIASLVIAVLADHKWN